MNVVPAKDSTPTAMPHPLDLPYVYRWDRQGRKGQLCRVTARGKKKSIRVEFADGYVMVSSGYAIRRAKEPLRAKSTA